MKKRWQDIVVLLLSFWLIISPFLLSRTVGDEALFTNSLIVGVFVQLTAIAAIMRPNAWKEWVLVILSSWLIASSYFFDTGENFTVAFALSGLAENNLIVGVLIMLSASFGLYRRQAIRDMDKPRAA